MPIYEYDCRDCAHGFELLVRGDQAPECPSCHGTALERRLSVFAARTGAGEPQASSAPAGCGRCGDPRGPGACSMN